MSAITRYIEDYITPEQLKQMVADGRTYASIAREYGFSTPGVSSYARRNGMTQRCKRVDDLIPPDELSEMLDSGITYSAIGKKYGVCVDTVRKYAKRILNTNDLRKKPELEHILEQEDDGVESMTAIAKRVGCPRYTVRYYRHKRNRKCEKERTRVCKVCECLPWDGNELQEDGVCLWCHLQEEGKTILYDR